MNTTTRLSIRDARADDRAAIRDLFVCRKCGYTLHADLNGARNIAAKYRAEGGISAVGGLNVNQPIVSDPVLRRSD
jgi:transposase